MQMSFQAIIISWVSQRMSRIYNKFMPSQVKITVISRSFSFEIITPQNISTHTISQVEMDFFFCDDSRLFCI
jgi:hypothetical protein